MRGGLRSILKLFLRGLIALIPLLAVIVVIGWLVSLINEHFGPASFFGAFIVTVVGPEQRYLAYVIVYGVLAALIVLLGFLLSRPAAARAFTAANAKVAAIPFVGKLYAAVSQVIDVLGKREGALERFGGVGVVRAGNVQLVCFLTTGERYTFPDGTDYYLVFIPNSPIPATGFNALVPVESFTRIDLPVTQVVKLLMSMGLLGPQVLPRSAPLREAPAAAGPGGEP